MAKGGLDISRTKQTQPDPNATRKGQKRFAQGTEVSAEAVNNEFDYIHERINQVVVEAAALPDLALTETLANTIARVNALAEILRSAGLLKSQ